MRRNPVDRHVEGGFWVRGVFGLVFVVVAFAPPAKADPIFIGAVRGHFENPVVQATSSYVNNGNYLSWGLPSAGGGTAPGGSSWFTFFGNPNVTALNGQSFALGTFRYENALSTPESLIFGVTLVLDFVLTDQTGQTYPSNVDSLRIPISINTTLDFSGTARPDTATFGAAFTSNGGRSLSVGEGFGVTATLYGSIVGDPYFVLDDLTVTTGIRYFPDGNAGPFPFPPGLPANFNGYFDELPPDIFRTFPPDLQRVFGFVEAATIPEPASVTLFGLTVCGVLACRWRKGKA